VWVFKIERHSVEILGRIARERLRRQICNEKRIFTKSSGQTSTHRSYLHHPDQRIQNLDSEPLQVVILVHRHSVANALRSNTNNLCSVTVDNLRVSVLGRVCNVVVELHAVDTGPLLELLVEVVPVDEEVGEAVVRLDLRVLARVAGVHGLDLGNPLGLRLDDLAVCAARVRRAGARAGAARQTACSDAGVACRGGEDVWVRGHHDVGHHAAGAGARDEDLARVGAELRRRPLDHLDQALVVAALVAREALGCVGFPAVVVALRRREERDEALLL
jgi:hypothetical protein